jgi:hypothetical protein
MSVWLRAALFLMTAWFTLDASTPFVPGAFQFSADESLEAVRAPGHAPAAPPHRAPGIPTHDTTLPTPADAVARARSSIVPPRVRRGYRDRSGRQDHDRASSIRQSDPA